MGVIRTVLVGMAVVSLSGCAGGKTSQALNRLQSQVGLLDQRVSQLERAGGAWQASEVISEPATEPVQTVATGAASAAGASKGITVTVKPSTREIQQALKNSGFYRGSLDGKMGPMTRESIKEFQRVHGLKDDGVVGKQTWTQLSTYANLSSDSGELGAAENLK